MNKKNTLNYPKSAAEGFFPWDSGTRSKTAVIREPPVFEPLKFYCTCIALGTVPNYFPCVLLREVNRAPGKREY